QAEDDELRSMVATVNEPEFERSLRELVVDAKARRNAAKPDQQPGLDGCLHRRSWPDQSREAGSGNERENKTHAEHPRGMAGVRCSTVLCVPCRAEESPRIPQAAKQET